MNKANFFFLFILLNSVQALIDKDWNKYKASFQLEFSNHDKDKAYEETWKKNIAYIKQHNERYSNNSQTYSMTINKFTHLRHEEFIAQYTGYKRRNSSESRTRKLDTNNSIFERKSIPESIDWSTNTNVVGPIKNQGSCG